MAEPLCPICGQALDDDYLLAAIDYSTWRSIIVHPSCWTHRNELAASGISVMPECDDASQNGRTTTNDQTA